MRWNSTVTLLTKTQDWQDEEGAWHRGTEKRRTVYCNEHKYAGIFMGNLRSNDVRSLNNNLIVDVGSNPEVNLELRTVEYHGEERCLYKGTEYIIVYAVTAGENVIIAISRRLGNRGTDV